MKGWQPVKEQAEASAASFARAQETRLPELWVATKYPGPYVIRFLEQDQDVNSYAVHRLGAFGSQDWTVITCLSEAGQECPACKAGVKLTRRGVFNVIQRGRPQLRKGADGKSVRDQSGNFLVDGYRDEVVVANVSSTTAEMLRKADADYRGLMSRDFQVTYSGDNKQAWSLAPVLDSNGSSNPTPMSEADMALAAAKHDLDKFMAPPSAQEAAQIIAKYVTNAPVAAGAPQLGTQPPANPYLTGQPGALPVGGAFGAMAGQQS